MLLEIKDWTFVHPGIKQCKESSSLENMIARQHEMPKAQRSHLGQNDKWRRQATTKIDV